MKNKILKAGFDDNAELLSGLKLLGLSGVEIGPVTHKQEN